MDKYALHGKLKTTPGNAKSLAGILLEAAKIISTAKGSQLYLVSRDESEPVCVWITEDWDSKENHDESLKNPAVRELIAQAMPLLDGIPQKGQELEVLGGFGI